MLVVLCNPPRNFAGGPDQHIVRGWVVGEAAAAALLATGAIANLISRRLVIWSTFLVMAGYFVTIIFLPLTVWGWFTLRAELDRTAR